MQITQLRLKHLLSRQNQQLFTVCEITNKMYLLMFDGLLLSWKSLFIVYVFYSSEKNEYF